jgi:trimethylamine-N-oxide reductase (cytochrome c)
MVVSSFLVEAQRVNIDELRKQYPEAFRKKYDPASGLRFNARVEGG